MSFDLSAIPEILRPALEGDTVHYSIKASITRAREPEDHEHSITQEVTRTGDAKPGQPVFLDAGTGAKGRRVLIRIVFSKAEPLPGK